jgi:drug/metabolite transporter (DMT)-like permease
MSFSDDRGITYAIAIGLLVGFASQLFIRRNENRLTWLLVIPVSAAGFAISFALINPLSQPTQLTTDWLRDEIANGGLALRASAVTYGLTFLNLVRRVSLTLDPKFEYDEYYWDAAGYAAEDRRMWLWTPERITRESSIFTLVLASLLLFAAGGDDSTVTAMLNWAAAFALKDYSVAAEYRVRDLVTPTTWRSVRIGLPVVGVVVLFVWAAWKEFSAVTALALSAFVLVLLVGIPVGAWLRRTGVSLLTSIGIDPNDVLAMGGPGSDAIELHGDVANLLAASPGRENAEDGPVAAPLDVLAWNLVWTAAHCTTEGNAASDPPAPLETIDEFLPYMVSDALMKCTPIKPAARAAAVAGVESVLVSSGWRTERVEDDAAAVVRTVHARLTRD